MTRRSDQNVVLVAQNDLLDDQNDVLVDQKDVLVDQKVVLVDQNVVLVDQKPSRGAKRGHSSELCSDRVLQGGDYTLQPGNSGTSQGVGEG